MISGIFLIIKKLPAGLKFFHFFFYSTIDINLQNFFVNIFVFDDLLGLVRVLPRLADDFVVDCDEPSAALAVPKQSTAPVGAISPVCVAAEGVAVVD